MNREDRHEVERMILEAKLETAETRLKIFFTVAGALLGVFGILIPLILAINSSSQIDKSIVRVDRAIERMEQSFKELAGTQLRRPEIECYFKGKSLADAILNLNQHEAVAFEIKNQGDAPATNIRLHLYIAKEKGIDRNAIMRTWEYSEFSDEPEYSRLFVFFSESYLDPQNTVPVEWSIQTLDALEWESTALLKIYYGQPEPQTYTFRIHANKK